MNNRKVHLIAGCFDISRIARAHLRADSLQALQNGRLETAASFFSMGSPEKFHFNTARILCTGVQRARVI